MEIVSRTVEELVDVGVAARAQQVVTTGTVLVQAVVERVGDNRRQRPQKWQVRPKTIPGRDVRPVELTRSRSPKSLARVVLVPDVQIEHLRALDDRETDDAPGSGGPGTTASHRDHLRLQQRAAADLATDRPVQPGLGSQRAAGARNIRWLQPHCTRIYRRIVKLGC